MTELTSAEVLGAASTRLTRAGFQSGPELHLPTGDDLRSFEDDVSIVGVVQYRSWSALRAGWLDAQSILVDLLTDRLDRSDPKSWEGYLVLLTIDQPSDPAEVDDIRRDTTRLRKIVASGTDLASVSDVEAALLPVLPLATAGFRTNAGSVLDRLPELLDLQGIDRDLSARVVAAFENDRPLMEAVAMWNAAQ